MAYLKKKEFQKLCELCNMPVERLVHPTCDAAFRQGYNKGHAQGYFVALNERATEIEQDRKKRELLDAQIRRTQSETKNETVLPNVAIDTSETDKE